MKTNKLKNEDSPYLQQYKNNPLNWYPWGDEAFNKAKKENKLIFLSIGYSTCHWCHVMEEESFENEEIATFINSHFVSIKVDREEMPHIDRYYQDVFILLNQRSGGWPLSVILTPQRKVFFSATYIPSTPKYNFKGIVEVFTNVNNYYKNNTQDVEQRALLVENAMNNPQKIKKISLDLKIVDKYIKIIKNNFDNKNYGIGTSPKFPYAFSIEAMLDIYLVNKNKDLLDMSEKMLKAMANGGIYDQIEGGFYRYSVDEAWIIPHFEKMLYTNGELLSAYSKAYLLTQDKFYKNIIKEIVLFIKERFVNNNLLYSASDADSLVEMKKEEGAYFVFEYDESFKYLQKNNIKNIDEALNYFNITKKGNFENQSTNPYLSNNKKPKNIEKLKSLFKQLRLKKDYPFVDKKILTSWNGMYIYSLLEASIISDDYLKEALDYLDALISNLYINDILYHQKISLKQPKIKALLEDYAFLIQALLKAYDLSLNDKYLKLANTINKQMIKKLYFDNSFKMSEDGFKVETSLGDGAYKSSLAVVIDNILKLSLLYNDLELYSLGSKLIDDIKSRLNENPSGMSYLLRSFVAFKEGYICIKANKDKLDGKWTNYPFLLRQKSKDNQFIACKIKTCFAFSKDKKEIKKLIEKEINLPIFF
jgi:uncharacterized protein YyaL (SSP411 family)